VALASEPIAEIIENYHRDREQQQQQQLSAGTLVPPDVFVKLQFGDDSRVSFIIIICRCYASYISRGCLAGRNVLVFVFFSNSESVICLFIHLIFSYVFAYY